MSPSDANDPIAAAPAASDLVEIRYSLPALLAELREERTTGSFAMEKLHQTEIGKLFQTRKKHRAKKS